MRWNTKFRKGFNTKLRNLEIDFSQPFDPTPATVHERVGATGQSDSARGSAPFSLLFQNTLVGSSGTDQGAEDAGEGGDTEDNEREGRERTSKGLVQSNEGHTTDTDGRGREEDRAKPRKQNRSRSKSLSSIRVTTPRATMGKSQPSGIGHTVELEQEMPQRRTRGRRNSVSGIDSKPDLSRVSTNVSEYRKVRSTSLQKKSKTVSSDCSPYLEKNADTSPPKKKNSKRDVKKAPLTQSDNRAKDKKSPRAPGEKERRDSNEKLPTASQKERIEKQSVGEEKRILTPKHGDDSKHRNLRRATVTEAATTEEVASPRRVRSGTETADDKKVESASKESVGVSNPESVLPKRRSSRNVAEEATKEELERPRQSSKAEKDSEKPRRGSKNEEERHRHRGNRKSSKFTAEDFKDTDLELDKIGGNAGASPTASPRKENSKPMSGRRANSDKVSSPRSPRVAARQLSMGSPDTSPRSQEVESASGAPRLSKESEEEGTDARTRIATRQASPDFQKRFPSVGPPASAEIPHEDSSGASRHESPSRPNSEILRSGSPVSARKKGVSKSGVAENPIITELIASPSTRSSPRKSRASRNSVNDPSQQGEVPEATSTATTTTIPNTDGVSSPAESIIGVKSLSKKKRASTYIKGDATADAGALTTPAPAASSEAAFATSSDTTATVAPGRPRTATPRSQFASPPATTATSGLQSPSTAHHDTSISEEAAITSPEVAKLPQTVSLQRSKTPQNLQEALSSSEVLTLVWRELETQRNTTNFLHLELLEMKKKLATEKGIFFQKSFFSLYSQPYVKIMKKKRTWNSKS